MKTFELTKGVKIVLIALFVIVIGAITVGMLTNDDVMAAKTCSCGSPMTLLSSYQDYTYHKWICSSTSCGREATEKHSYDGSNIYALQTSTNMHAWYSMCPVCTYPYRYSSGPCSDSTGDGLCDNCGEYTSNTGSSGGNQGGGSTGGDCSNGNHSWSSLSYEPFDNTIHHIYGITCTSCGLDRDWYSYGNHECSSATNNGNGTHSGICTLCKGTATVAHTIVTLQRKEPTCTETGLTAGEKCSECNYTKAQTTIAALGHNWQAATCTTPKTCSTCGATEGSTGEHNWKAATCLIPKTCSVCNATEGSVAEHNWQEATCTTPKTCSVCNATEGSVAEHNWQEATCTEPKTCSVCNATEGNSLGHDWQEATCTTPKTCSRCDATEGSSLGHNWQVATCTTPKSCSRCDATEGNSLGHAWQAATCTTPKSCSRCDATEGSALGHNWQAATCTSARTCSRCSTTDGNILGHDWQAATCTTPKTCSRCNTTEGNSLGHNWQEATCTAPKTCSRCNETEGNALGHNWQEATCTIPKTCSICNTTEGNALGHHYEEGKCTRCSQDEPQEEIEINISSEKYELNDTYISNIQSGTEFADFIKEISTNATTISVYNKDNETVSSTEKIGTGMRIVLQSGETTKTFTIIVRGDADGNGEADFQDIVKINRARLNKATLDEPYALAAEVTGDGEIEFQDIVKINRFRLKKITSL